MQNHWDALASVHCCFSDFPLLTRDPGSSCQRLQLRSNGAELFLVLHKDLLKESANELGLSDR